MVGLDRTGRYHHVVGAIVFDTDTVGKQKESIMNSMDIIKQKIIPADRLSNLISLWRFKDETIVFTNGCFDILHYGHIHLLSSAKNFGSKLIVGMNSDDSTKRLKGEGRPINAETDRAMLLASLNMIDAVIVFEEDSWKPPTGPERPWNGFRRTITIW